MASRKQKVEALLSDLRSLRRALAFRMTGPAHIPRITPAQWGALMLVEQAGTSAVKDVAKALGVTSSAATQLVDGLVAGGYLTRKTHTKDRRIATLTLSKRSSEQVARMKKHALARFLKIFAVLTDAEFDRYLALTKKIVRRFLLK